MPATIDETVGGASANSYVTLVEAEAFFDAQPLTTAWDAAADDDAKNRALIAAAARIDQEEFLGEPVNPLTGTSSGTTQAMKWPRTDVLDAVGNEYLSTVIPEKVKRAQFKLAYILLDDAEFAQDTGLEGFSRAKVGPLEVEPRHSRSAGDLPDDVLRELRGLLATGSALNFAIQRGG